jgi:hypothetical protein
MGASVLISESQYKPLKTVDREFVFHSAGFGICSTWLGFRSELFGFPSVEFGNPSLQRVVLQSQKKTLKRLKRLSRVRNRTASVACEIALCDLRLDPSLAA